MFPLPPSSTRWRNCFFRKTQKKKYLSYVVQSRKLISIFPPPITNHSVWFMFYFYNAPAWKLSMLLVTFKKVSRWQRVQPSRSVNFMSYTAAITILKNVSIFQGLCIFTGNFITMIVFWIHRYKLKRTSFLLINLAVADLLAGLTQTVIAAKAHPQTISADILTCFQAAVLAASVLFLVFISLERAYALIYPLRHRVASTTAYINTIMIVWLIAITWGASCLLVVFDIFEFKFYIGAFSVTVFIGLVTICLCYVAIQAKLRQESTVIDPANNRHNAERNTKLSKTFCIVISASVALWVPGLVFSCIYFFFPWYSVIMNYVSFILHQTNSLLNPIIYSLRMPFFKESFKRLKNKMKIRKQTKMDRVKFQTSKTEHKLCIAKF